MKKYLVAFLNEIKLNLRYRFNLVLSTTGLILPLLGYIFLWRTVYAKGGMVGDYSLSGLFTYYFWALLLNNVLPIYAYGDLAWNIRAGGLSLFLVRPVSYLGYYFAIMTGGNLMWLVANLMALIPFLFIFVRYFMFPTLPDFLLGVLFSAIGYLLAIFSGFILNLFAFWFGRTQGFRVLYGWTLTILGGGLLPLEVLGDVFVELPFRFLYYIPARAFTGKLRTDVGALLFEGMFWILVAIGITVFLWKKGLRRYEACGG